MTKADLIEGVSQAAEIDARESEIVVNAIFNAIIDFLANGDRIKIRGFGSFRTRQRQARIGRNPKTGSRLEVPAKNIAYFTPTKGLRDLVNNAATALETPAHAAGIENGTP